MDRINSDARAALAEAHERYVARNPRSAGLHEAACAAMPGGNTRTTLFYPPFPLMLERGAGCRVWDADGHQYVDLLGEYTAGLFGHSHPAILGALRDVLDGGINLGGHTALEARFARAVCDRFPSLELVRFTNSGTEANLMALSTARVVTGRETILVFDGGYHGGTLNFTDGGMKLNVPFRFVLGRYNDIEATRAAIAAARDDLAAILVEPMQGSGGCIPAERSFLEGLREIARACGALLIFDEIMTSRLAPGGLQELVGVRPDMTTLGKYIGGGMSFGAFGGRRDLMERYDPRRPGYLPHGGTFNNNVLTMAAGIAALTEVYTPEAARALNERGDGLRERLAALAKKHGAAVQVTGRGSMINFHMTREPIRSIAEVRRGDMTVRDLLFFDFLERGLYMARRGMINLSLPIGAAELDAVAAAFEEFLTVRRNLLD